MLARPTRIPVVALALMAAASACTKAGPVGPTCTVPLTGTPWSPNVPGASSSNHDSNVTVTTAIGTSTPESLRTSLTKWDMTPIPSR